MKKHKTIWFQCGIRHIDYLSLNFYPPPVMGSLNNPFVLQKYLKHLKLVGWSSSSLTNTVYHLVNNSPLQTQFLDYEAAQRIKLTKTVTCILIITIHTN